MTEETLIETPVAKQAKAPRIAAVLTLSAEDGTSLPVLKYPMPVKAPRFDLMVNDQVVQAAQTSFKDKGYTYFQYNGVDFYVSGHLDKEVAYTFTVPEGYEFKPLKLDRKAQADAAAVNAKTKKAAAAAAAGQAPGSEESPLAGVESASEGGSSSPTENEPESASTPVAPRGKKAKR
jgi:hypothetical protein